VVKARWPAVALKDATSFIRCPFLAGERRELLAPFSE